MVIYGLALLSGCFFGGMLLGDILGMITIVVAMTACQDVAAAIMGGGVLTIMCGIVCTIVPLLLIPVISKLGAPSEPLPPLSKE